MKLLVYSTGFFLMLSVEAIEEEREICLSLTGSINGELSQNYGTTIESVSESVVPPVLQDLVVVDFSKILVWKSNGSIYNQVSCCREGKDISLRCWGVLMGSFGGLVWLAIEALKYYDEHSPYDPPP